MTLYLAYSCINRSARNNKKRLGSHSHISYNFGYETGRRDWTRLATIFIKVFQLHLSVQGGYDTLGKILAGIFFVLCLPHRSLIQRWKRPKMQCNKAYVEFSFDRDSRCKSYLFTLLLRHFEKHNI